jgi:hypothetical protein
MPAKSLPSFSFHRVCKYLERLSVWRVRDIPYRSSTERSIEQVYMEAPHSQHGTHILKFPGNVAVNLEGEMRLQILYNIECLGKLDSSVSDITTRAINPRRLKKV